MGIDGDGSRARHRDAARKRTASGMRTCALCGRRSTMARYRTEIGIVVFCRYCKGSYQAANPPERGREEKE